MTFSSEKQKSNSQEFLSMTHPSPSELSDNHLRTHSRHNLYNCNHCDYEIDQQGYLRAYLKTEKSYKRIFIKVDKRIKDTFKNHSGENLTNATNVGVHLLKQLI